MWVDMFGVYHESCRRWRNASSFNVKRISTEGTAGEYVLDDVGVAKIVIIGSRRQTRQFVR